VLYCTLFAVLGRTRHRLKIRERVIESLSKEAAGIVPVAPYDPRNTGEPKDIEYILEHRITEHSEEYSSSSPS